MEEELTLDVLLQEIFERSWPGTLQGLLRCLILDDKFHIVHDYKGKLETGGTYLSGARDSKDLEICRQVSEAFELSGKLGEYFGVQEFYSCKMSAGLFTLTVKHIQCDRVNWHLAFVSTVDFSNDALLVEIAGQLDASIKQVQRISKTVS